MLCQLKKAMHNGVRILKSWLDKHLAEISPTQVDCHTYTAGETLLPERWSNQLAVFQSSDGGLQGSLHSIGNRLWPVADMNYLPKLLTQQFFVCSHRPA